MYNVSDCCFGIISSRSQRGSFIELDNGESAFCYNSLRAGTKVLCSVLRPALGEKRKLVSIDSIIYEQGASV